MDWITLIVAIFFIGLGLWGLVSRQKWLEDLAKKGRDSEKNKH